MSPADGVAWVLVSILSIASMVAAEPRVGAAGTDLAPDLPPIIFGEDASQLDSHEVSYLEALFARTDEAVVENTILLRWLAHDARAGRGFPAAGDARDRLVEIRSRIAALEPPPRLRAVARLVVEALDHQRRFFADALEALEAGRSFRSQLDDEFAWHPAPQRAREALITAYAELRGLLPDLEADTRDALNAHLRALDLGP